MLSTVRTEFGPRHFNPTVAKRRVRGVLFCAGGETRRLIPRYRKGLQRSGDRRSLSSRVAREPNYSHERPSDVPFSPKLSAVSPSRAAWVIEGLRALFRSQPTGVAFATSRLSDTKSMLALGNEVVRVGMLAESLCCRLTEAGQILPIGLSIRIGSRGGANMGDRYCPPGTRDRGGRVRSFCASLATSLPTAFGDCQRSQKSEPFSEWSTARASRIVFVPNNKSKLVITQYGQAE